MKDKKTITQVTFDAAVRENMNEFEMSPEDAVADSIRQFEAQNVDLSNIVTKLSLEATDSGTVATTPSDRASQLVEALKAVAEETLDDERAISMKLADIKAECDLSLAHRCLLASYHVTELLVGLFKKAQSKPELLLKILGTLTSVTSGQPDVITAEHVQLFCGGLKEFVDNPSIVVALLRLLHNSCVKHEGNRQACIENGLVDLLISGVFAKHKAAPDVVKIACSSLRVLTLDDDIRVPYGKAHEHTKMIVTDYAGIKTLLRLAKETSYEGPVLAEIMITLSCLCVRNEFCQEIVDEGGLQLVVHTVLENIENQALVRSGLSLLKSIAGNDAVKNEIVKNSGIDLILTAMNKHQAEPQVCEAGCACFSALALRSPSNCQAIVEAGGAATIITSMKIHKDSAPIQKWACRAIRNLVSRTRHYNQNFLDLGAEHLIREARKQHVQVQDDAKAALRDLGCQVELQELWTGKKGALE